MKLLVCNSPGSVIKYVGEENFTRYYGLLSTPRSGNRPEHALKHQAPWAIDNDAFNGFHEHKFNLLLNRFKGLPGCLFCVAPDVVGDAKATLHQFKIWQPIIRSYGYPVALAAQDGLEKLRIPWTKFDALFIGGSTQWKLGIEAANIAAEAKRRGKVVHMGRVNSAIRLRYAQRIGCDTVDGSGYAAFLRRTKEALPILATHQLPLLGVA